MDIIERLSAPFHASVISWRVGSTNGDKTKGMALAYIDARDAQDRLNEVCGPFGWQCRHEVSQDKRVTCHVGIRDPDSGEWVWKSDGAGETDYEGEKGSYSDSFKRACVKWGIGRYLYDCESPWVAIEQRGRTLIIPPASASALTKKLEAWQRAYFSKSLPDPTKKVIPANEAWAALDEDTKAALLKLAAEVETKAAKSIGDAFVLIESKGLSQEERAGLWSQLSSKTRSALKNANTPESQRKAA
jgi:hypothetical protein